MKILHDSTAVLKSCLFFLIAWPGEQKGTFWKSSTCNLNWTKIHHFIILFCLLNDAWNWLFSNQIHKNRSLCSRLCTQSRLASTRTFVRLESLGDIGCHKSSRRIVKQLSKWETSMGTTSSPSANRIRVWGSKARSMILAKNESIDRYHQRAIVAKLLTETACWMGGAAYGSIGCGVSNLGIQN